MNRAATTILVLGLTALGCAGPPPAPTTAGVPLPTREDSGACAGVGLDAEVRGDPRDPSVVWLQSFVQVGVQKDPLGDRIEVVWPSGYTAVFDPALRILDPSGQTALHEADHIDGGCVTGDGGGGPLFIPGKSDGFRLQCGEVERSTCTSVLNATLDQSDRWPKERIASFIVRDETGNYTVVFEDGQRFDGYASPNL